MGGIIGGIFQARAANKAAKVQANAAAQDLAFQRETRDMNIQRLDPFYQQGLTAQNALSYEMGLGDKPANYTGFTASPGYQFQFDQGVNAVNALAGARGGLNSGRTMQDLTQFGQGLANQEYGNWLNRLSGISATGQNAAAGQVGAAQSAAGAVSNAISNQANARASGIVGSANALASGINNQIGMFQYQRGVNGGGSVGNSNFFNPLFGGKGLGGFF